MDTKYVTGPGELKAGADAGALRAVFSTFGVVDRGNDLVTAGAFTDGQEVPMVWAHDWHKPVGKGTVRVLPDRAVFDGRFNLATTWGRDAYEAVKFAGPLQEYSFGFRVTDEESADVGGERVRVIKGAEVFEVSPVLVGEGLGTHTLTLKHDLDEDDHFKAQWDTSFINNLADSAFAYIEPGGSKDSEGKTVPRSLRHFPHHGPGGAVDLPHLRNALARAPQSPFGDRALPHLNRHASAEGVGGKEGEDVAAELKRGARLSRESRAAIRAVIAGLVGLLGEDDALDLAEAPPPEEKAEGMAEARPEKAPPRPRAPAEPARHLRADYEALVDRLGLPR